MGDLPIGAALRKTKRSSTRDIKNDRKATSLLSLDEQIALLEKDMNGSEEDDDSISTQVDEDDVDTDGILVEEDENGNVVRMVSGIAKDAIAPLPSELLPLPMCASRNPSHDKSAAKRSSEHVTATTKRIRFSDENTETKSNQGTAMAPSKLGGDSSGNKKHQESGLEATIREMFSKYVPTSADRRPFWCRLCQFQGSDLNDFEQHRESEQHNLAVEIEKKMAYCKLCKKRFTSMAQLKEHISGSGHKEFLQKVRTSQKKNMRFS